MVRRAFGRLRPPSLSTAISLLALSIVVTGTAWAATGQIVNIADGTSAGNIARVGGDGSLKTAVTSGNVGVAVPKTQFQHSFFVGEGANTVIGPTKATLALSRVLVSNHGAGSLRHDVRVQLEQRASNGTACDGINRTLAGYDTKPNSTVIDPLPTPMQLKPYGGASHWCLQASVIIVDDSGGYYLPTVGLHGHVVSGTYSGAARPEATGARPPKAGGAAG